MKLFPARLGNDFVTHELFSGVVKRRRDLKPKKKNCLQHEWQRRTEKRHHKAIQFQRARMKLITHVLWDRNSDFPDQRFPVDAIAEGPCKSR